MLRKMLCVLAAMALVAMAMPAKADTLLVDFNFSNQTPQYYEWDPPSGLPLYSSTYSDFVDAGVTEDITDAPVWNYLQGIVYHGPHFQSYDHHPYDFGYPTAQNPMVGGVELFLSDPVTGTPGTYDPAAWCARGFNKNPGGCTDLAADYVYLSGPNDGVMGGPVNVEITGLASRLSPNHEYKLYLWGTAGTATDQNSTFTFGDQGSKTTSDVDLPVTFDYVTGATVEDSLTIRWEGADWAFGCAAWNGFALVEGAEVDGVVIPEPSALALLGLGALALRRRRS